MLLAVLFSFAALPVPAAAEGPCAAAAYRAFDFWLGEWRVTLPDGQVAGHNRIEAGQQGCVLVEHWRGSGGGTGTSLSFFEPERQQWRQVWVSPQTQIDIAGALQDAAMVLEGDITYLKDGRTLPFRGTWTPLDNGEVRQHFEERRPEQGWVTWFDGRYAPLEPSAGMP